MHKDNSTNNLFFGSDFLRKIAFEYSVIYNPKKREKNNNNKRKLLYYLSKNIKKTISINTNRFIT